MPMGLLSTPFHTSGVCVMDGHSKMRAKVCNSSLVNHYTGLEKMIVRGIIDN